MQKKKNLFFKETFPPHIRLLLQPNIKKKKNMKLKVILKSLRFELLECKLNKIKKLLTFFIF